MTKQNRKQRAANRIQSIRSKLNSGSTKSQLQSFLADYFMCEMACKEMMVGYQDSIKKPIKYEETKMDLRVLKAVFNVYGIALSDDVRNRLFSSSPKSAKKLRDSLVHGISKKNLDTLAAQYGTKIKVIVQREVEAFYDFEDDNSFETAVIDSGLLEETAYYDRPEPPGELGYCPACGRPLSIENDGGNGFCINCALEHD